MKALDADPVHSIMHAVTIISAAYTGKRDKNDWLPMANTLQRGLEIALPYWIKKRTTAKYPPPEEPIEGILEDLIFMSHYYMARDILYYTYNSPGSFEWEFSPDSIRIKFFDPSIPRQFMAYANAVYLDRADVIHGFKDSAAEICTTLRGQEELGDGPHIQHAFPLIRREADLRLKGKFSILDAIDDVIELNGYTYADFRATYQHLFEKALYHRYFARANNLPWPTYTFSKSGLVSEISINTGIDASVVELILADISYGPITNDPHPMNYGIIDHPDSPDYFIIAERMIDQDGYTQLLRAQASRSPANFSTHISGPLGTALVSHCASFFQEAGFLTLSNVHLRDVDPQAPDIDLLVISREPTLGYCVFACEVKATLPAFWAKDYLRALRQDSLTKAFKQTNKVRSVLSTRAGYELIVNRILSADPNPLTDGVIVIRTLIVTSQNSGMFFEEESQTQAIIDYRTLSRIVDASDGDVVYLLEKLYGVREMFTPSTATLSFQLDNVTVQYEVVADNPILEFEKTTWRSDGTDVQVTEQFLAEGRPRGCTCSSPRHEARDDCPAFRTDSSTE
ncbi:hypothetical protein [Nonomuraea sp. NPDC049158]|uniref:hypothetical protein n=1 Tax=Nonomuraea sp. NPDC049158 TaxID=3155649 RepID=UPI0033C46B1D